VYYVLLLNVIDFLARKTIYGRDYGTTQGTEKLADVDFAEDIALTSDSPTALQNMTTELRGNASNVGL